MLFKVLEYFKSHLISFIAYGCFFVNNKTKILLNKKLHLLNQIRLYQIFE